jgi:hypothetical protein
VRYVYQAVERTPKPLSNGVVYHSEEFEVGALLCACGCGHRVSLLVPDSHQITSEGGMATVRPSIAVCDAPCKSQYFISAGRVEWLPAFSDAMATSVMSGQIARHAIRDAKRQSWGSRVRAAIARGHTTNLSRSYESKFRVVDVLPRFLSVRFRCF